MVRDTSDGDDIDIDVARNLSREMPNPQRITNEVDAILGPVHAVHKVLSIRSRHIEDAVHGGCEGAHTIPDAKNS